MTCWFVVPGLTASMACYFFDSHLHEEDMTCWSLASWN